MDSVIDSGIFLMMLRGNKMVLIFHSKDEKCIVLILLNGEIMVQNNWGKGISQTHLLKSITVFGQKLCYIL